MSFWNGRPPTKAVDANGDEKPDLVVGNDDPTGLVTILLNASR